MDADVMLVLVGCVAFGAVIALLVYAAWLLVPQCRQCQRRGTLRWHRERVNGGPDRRFRENFQYCQACGFGRREES